MPGRRTLLETAVLLWEPLVVLSAALLLTQFLATPLVPRSSDALFPLRPVESAEGRLTEDELVVEVERLNLAPEVAVVLDSGETQLVLRGVTDVEPVVEPVLALLRRGGFQSSAHSSRASVPRPEVLRAHLGRITAAQMIHTGIFILLGLAMIRTRVTRQAREARSGWPAAVGVGLAGGLALMPISLAVATALELIGFPVVEQEWVRLLFADPAIRATMAVWLVVFGPVSEEIFFRGYVLRFLAPEVGYPAALLVSSSLFALTHFNPSGFLVYLVIGCVLGYLQRRSGRLISPIMAHVAYNALAFAFSG